MHKRVPDAVSRNRLPAPEGAPMEILTEQRLRDLQLSPRLELGLELDDDPSHLCPKLKLYASMILLGNCVVTIMTPPPLVIW